MKRSVATIAAAVLLAGLASCGTPTTDTAAETAEKAAASAENAAGRAADKAEEAAEKAAEKAESEAEDAAEEAESEAADTSGDPSTKFPMQDGDWRLDSLSVKNDGLGDFGGRARITYTGDDADGGSNLFTVTVFKAGKDIGTITGAASDVAPGRAKTVQLISSDKYVSGTLKYTFQNDM